MASCQIAGADSATLVLAAATSYQELPGHRRRSRGRCASVMEAVAGKDYDALREAHVADHQELFRRVSLDLGTHRRGRPADRRAAQAVRPTATTRSWRRSTSSSAATC